LGYSYHVFLNIQHFCTKYIVKAGRVPGTITFINVANSRVYKNEIYPINTRFIVVENSITIIQRANGKIEEFKINQAITYNIGDKLLGRKANNSQKESEKNILQTILGGLMGEWNEDPSLSEIGIDFVTSIIPIADQVADARDLAAHLYFMLFKGELNKIERWVGLGFTLIGIVPEIGTVIKSLSKVLTKGTKEALQHADEILATINKLLPGISVSQLQKFIASRWDNAVSAGKNHWFNFLNLIKGTIEKIPGIGPLAARKQQALDQIQQVLSVSDSLLDQAFAEVRRIIDEVFDALGGKLDPNGQLVPAGGTSLSNRVDGGGSQQILKIEGGRGANGNIGGVLSDEQLIAAVQRGGYANPQHMAELLRRTDIPADKLQQARANLSEALNSGKFSPENLQKVITQLSSAKSVDQFDEVLAELKYPNRLIRTGAVAVDSQVILGAKQGQEYTLGSMKVKTDPVPDADVLYLGQNGIVHIDEVKNTANALRQKLNQSPKQLERLQDWLAGDPNKRAIRIVIENETGWTDIFAIRRGEENSVLQRLLNQGVPLSIGSYNLTIEKMGNLKDAIAKKYEKMQLEGTWKGWKDFYNQMSTPANAEKFLGVSLK
jgi:hypothetical protein